MDEVAAAYALKDVQLALLAKYMPATGPKVNAPTTRVLSSEKAEIIRATIASIGPAIEREHNALSSEIAALKAENAALKSENAALRGELCGKIEWLAAEIAQQKHVIAEAQKHAVAEVLERLGMPSQMAVPTPRRLS